MTSPTALIVGAGAGLSAALTRRLRREGYGVALAARSVQKLRELELETGAKAFACDATNAKNVALLFDRVARELGEPELVVYNASARVRGALVDLDPGDVERSIAVSAFGGFLVSQAAARRMLRSRWRLTSWKPDSFAIGARLWWLDGSSATTASRRL